MTAVARARQTVTRFLRNREDQAFFALCGLVGIGGGLINAIAHVGIDRARAWIFGGDGVHVAAAMGALPAWMRVAAPATGALAAGLLLLLLRAGGGGHGVPEVMEVVVLGKKELRFRGVLKKAFAAFTALISGVSIGREGPVIQLSTALAARAGMRFRLSEESYRILTAAGVAAGAAAAYHTPLAGTLFVVELIVGVINMRVLGAAGVAAILAGVTTEAVFGISASLPDVEFRVRSVLEYLGFALLGLAGGAAAAAFLWLLDVSARLFRRIPLPSPVSAALGGALVGCIGIRLPEVFGNGFDVVGAAVGGLLPLGALAAVLLWKPVATAVSVGCGIPGGVFAPTLLLGAAFGGVFGHGLNALFGNACAPPANYALLGMAATMSGTMHAPLLGAVLVVELTGSPSLVLPSLVVAFSARVGARLVRRESIFTDELRRRGVETEGPLEARVLQSLRVRDLLRADVALIPQTTTLGEVARIFSRTRALYIYVGDPDGRLVGAIDLHDVKGALAGEDVGVPVIAQDLAQPVPTALPEETIVEVNKRLWLQDVGNLPVVRSENDATYLGIITRRDILGAVDREILQRNVLLAPIRAAGADETDWFELPPGGRLESVRIPDCLVGKTIGESNLGREAGVTILAVTKSGADGREMRRLPRPEIRLERGDRMVVIGPEDAVERLLEDRFNLGARPADDGPKDAADRRRGAGDGGAVA